MILTSVSSPMTANLSQPTVLPEGVLSSDAGFAQIFCETSEEAEDMPEVDTEGVEIPMAAVAVLIPAPVVQVSLAVITATGANEGADEPAQLAGAASGAFPTVTEPDGDVQVLIGPGGVSRDVAVQQPESASTSSGAGMVVKTDTNPQIAAPVADSVPLTERPIVPPNLVASKLPEPPASMPELAVIAAIGTLPPHPAPAPPTRGQQMWAMLGMDIIDGKEAAIDAPDAPQPHEITAVDTSGPALTGPEVPETARDLTTALSLGGSGIGPATLDMPPIFVNQIDLALTQIGVVPSAGSAPMASAGTVPQPQMSALIPAILTERARPTEGGVTLTLAPEELGKLHMTLLADGDRMVMSIAVERPETLDLLRRHVDQLLQEMRQAGFAQTSFSFGQGDARGFARPAPAPAADSLFEPSPPPMSMVETVHRIAPVSAGLDIRI